MRALYWDGHEPRVDSSYPTPRVDSKIEGAASRIVRTTGTPPANENEPSALIQVHLAGICSTDLQILKGYMDFKGVPGHEFVGSVIDGPKDFVGKRVAGEINFGCGSCDACARDLGRHCARRSVMGILNADGAFAEYVLLPARNLHVVPESIDDEEAVFTEPLAAAFEILMQIQINPGDEVLVLGDGKLGNLCAQVLRLTGAKVTALGKHADKLALIKKAGVRTIRLDDWERRLFDIVVEATGSASALELALSAVRPRGTLILKSTIAGIHQVSLATIVINEINLIGSRCGPFPDALNALAAKQVSVRPLIEATYPLSEAVAAIDHAAKAGTRKILLRP
jgi:threonine dehydrogenase-like Zn-dependent dehydrogenase